MAWSWIWDVGYDTCSYSLFIYNLQDDISDYDESDQDEVDVLGELQKVWINYYSLLFH